MDNQITQLLKKNVDPALKKSHESLVELWIDNILMVLTEPEPETDTETDTETEIKTNTRPYHKYNKSVNAFKMFPKELIDLITLFSHRIELEFSDEWKGADVRSLQPNRVQFAINSGTSHCVALVKDVIDIEERLAKGVTTFAWEFVMNDVCHASWYMGVVEYPFSFGDRSKLDDAYLSTISTHYFGMDLGAEHVLGGNLKTRLAATDKFQFFADLEKREIEVCHNQITCLRDKWLNIPLKFIPAVCTRSNNECEVHLIPYSDLKRIKESENNKNPNPNKNNK